MEKLEIKDNTLKFLLKIFLAALFIFLSSYIVLELEWQRGEFIYYFFKTKIYYGQYNKIIFPVYYWAFLGLICLIAIRLDPLKSTRGHINEYIRVGFYFHIFLLLISKFEETLFDFTLTPLFFKPPAYSFIYDQFFFFLVFTSYYFFVAQRIKILRNSSKIEKAKISDLIACSSLLVIPFFVKDKVTLLGYMILGFGVSLLATHFLNSEFLKACKKNFIVKNLPIITIVVLSVFCRLWYAHYFASLGDKSIGIGADGPAYFQSALAFSEWNLKEVDFWHSPLYALYLGFFLFLFGDDVGTVFYCQALVGACAPAIIYSAVKSLWGNKIGFLSGILVALSHLSIHYSVVINRASLLTVIFPLILLVYLKLKKERSCIPLVLMGFLLSSSFYIGPESLFALLSVLIFIALKKRISSLRAIIGDGKWIILGILIVVIPINLISFISNDRLILSGRDSSDSNLSTSTFIYSASPSALKMKEMGFDPVSDIGNSLKVFIQYPLEIFSLLIGKLMDEIPGFLFDPGGRFLAPLHLTLDSFYGANLQFYIYFCISFGFIIFLRDKNIIWRDKALIISLITLYGLFSSLIVMGTFRFRAVLTPINMIFIALAINSIFTKQKITSGSEGEEKFYDLKNVKSSFLKLGIGLFFLGTLMIISKYYQNVFTHPEALELSRWKTFKKKIVETDILTINSNVFVHYDFKEIDLSNKSNFKFFAKVCRDLIPGKKPYYKVFFDGEFIGPAKEIPSGCSEIKEPFKLKYSKGIIGMIAFISDDGQTENPVPFLIKETKGKDETIMIPVVQNLGRFEDEDLKEFNRSFLKYSRGLIKISKPQIWFDS